MIEEEKTITCRECGNKLIGQYIECNWGEFCCLSHAKVYASIEGDSVRWTNVLKIEVKK